jgi:hypothetical protein
MKYFFATPICVVTALRSLVRPCRVRSWVFESALTEWPQGWCHVPIATGPPMDGMAIVASRTANTAASKSRPSARIQSAMLQIDVRCFSSLPTFMFFAISRVYITWTSNVKVMSAGNADIVCSQADNPYPEPLESSHTVPSYFSLKGRNKISPARNTR